MRDIIFGDACNGINACDCLIFTANGFLIVVELEKKVENFESYAKVQLLKCAEMAEKVLKECDVRIENPRVYFILVCKYWKDKLLVPSRDKSRLTVRFRGKERNVIIRCGGGKAYLSEILSKL